MKVHKLAAIPVLVTIAGLSLAACSGQPAPAAKPAATHNVATPVATTPAPAASPDGIWNVAYSSAPASILGQYSIAQQTVGTYTITTKTAIKLPDGNCSIPVNETEGTFTAVATNETYAYSGTEKIWEPGTCAYAYMSSFALTLSSNGNTLTQQIVNATPQAFTLTRAGSTPASTSSAAATPPVAAAPSPSSTGCPQALGGGTGTTALVPDITGNPSASAATEYVKNAGFNPVVVQKSNPGGNPAGGIFWGTNPPVGTRAPCGSTVTLYEQP